MKILITGGAGFVGSHLAERLVEDGDTVICLDNFDSGSIWNIRHLLDCRNFKLLKDDILNREALDKIMQGVDVIYHLAAQVHVDRSYIEPELTWRVNVLGTQNVLESARFHDVPKVVFASTSEVYGTAQFTPMNESHPLCAPHPYGASKIAADRMCYAYTQTYGMNILIFRFFNIFGPRQRDFGYGGVTSIFTKRILDGKPVVVYGRGKQVRDFTYVDDAVNAYRIYANGDIDGPVNFGSGEGISIADLAEKISAMANEPTTIVYDKPRIGEVEVLIADASKAHGLGWEPHVTLEDGLDKLIQWYELYG